MSKDLKFTLKNVPDEIVGKLTKKTDEMKLAFSDVIDFSEINIEDIVVDFDDCEVEDSGDAAASMYALAFSSILRRTLYSKSNTAKSAIDTIQGVLKVVQNGMSKMAEGDAEKN